MRYPLIYGFFTHYVEDAALELHTKSIKEKHNFKPVEPEEVSLITIDPGGMMRMNGPKETIELEDGFKFQINSEHVLIAANFYFNIGLFEEACMVFGGMESEYLMTIEVMSEDIVKVYLPYSVLVMTVDRYAHLCKEFNGLYLDGMNAYINLMGDLPSEHFVNTLANCVTSDDIGEA
jgi:hypothetical protein